MGAPSPSPDDSGVVAIGSVLDGRYRIDAVLGKGGMGRVYKGEHTGIGRAVAIKVLHAQLGRNKEATQRFQREALASGRLDHPNIVGVSDFGVLDDGSLYLVMEALEGESLGKRLERDKRIPWPEALAITRGVLAGLRHAHDKGVVHRDIKPDNIFLARKDGDIVVKILDFGIAKLYAGNADDPASTRAGLTVGTPAYLSPEQAVGGAITPAADLYSTSVVLYEMLVGRPPFEDTDPLQMLTAHVSRDAPTFAEVAPGLQVPPGLEDIVRHGLSKVAAERISSASEYVARLDDLARSAGYDAQLAAAHASASLMIPAGPHAPLATPMPGSFLTPMPAQMTFASEVGSAPAALVPTPTAQVRVSRKMSIADDGAPIPRKWLTIAAIVVAVGIVASGAYMIFGRGGSKDEPAGPAPAVPFAESQGDRDLRLKAALHDLETGRTCQDRKAAVQELADLGDPRAIPELRKARFRGSGGLLGIGESNANSCLTKDADAAIKALGGTPK
ncbi:MAG: serine/threonine-protein kinase [Acidobacteriota bacterium]